MTSRLIKPNAFTLCFAACAMEGVFALIILLSVPSEASNQAFFGLSKSRIVMLAGISVAVIAFGILSILTFREKFRMSVLRFLNKKRILQPLFAFFWVVLCAVLLVGIGTLSPLRTLSSLFAALVSRSAGLLIWIGLVCVQMLLLLYISAKINFSLLYKAVLFSFSMIVYGIFFAYYDHFDWSFHAEDLQFLIIFPILTAFCYALVQKYFQRIKNAEVFFLALFIFALTYFVYRSSGYYLGRWMTPAKAYWHELADAFLQGQLYLRNPSTFHDLTLYNGHWFVPNPPLPALLLMIPAFLTGSAANTNMVGFSNFFGALNAALLFLVLQKAAQMGMTRCTLSVNIWVTAVFALCTNHWWLAGIGQMWFVSQILALTCSALAAVAVLYNWSGYWCGLFLGLGLLARPNIFPLALFLGGIAIWKNGGLSKQTLKPILRWSLCAAIPAALCAFGLLYYNYVRFENWFDFGYITINGADWIMAAVQKYGMFHVHFFRENFDVMFLRTPHIILGGESFWFRPGIAGYSIFIMTPPLIFLIRSFRKNWWVISAWVSVLCCALLLLFYHNSGAEQIGYRYLMDFAVPLFLLLALGVGTRASVWFKLLFLCGSGINLLSMYWWYIGRAL